jgi:hypothetical protein
MALPSYGTLRYGPLNLNGPDVLTTRYECHPVMDPAGRGRTYSEYRVSARLIINAQPTDARVTAARQTLNTPGLAFSYSDRGFGSLNVDGRADVLWGPKCRVTSIKPYGGGNACELNWEAEVAVACEGGAELTTGGGVGEIIAWTFTANHDIDRAGYTTRRINVEIRVPGGRVGARGLARTADEYRDQLAAPQIPGFRRTYPGWSIDAAKTTCTGEIVDEEMGSNYPPEWCSDVTADMEVGSAGQGMAMWQATINAEYEIIKAAKVTNAEAVRHFIGTLVKDRVTSIADSLGGDANTIVPLSLRMREPEIYGRRKAAFSFSFSYTRQLKDILNATGLWRAVPGSNWQTWAQSMQLGPANPYGFSGLEIRPGDDSIVDGCGGNVPGLFRNTAVVPRPPVAPITCGLPGPPEPYESVLRTFFPAPTPQASWLFYECNYWLEVDSGTIPIPTLPAKKPTFVPKVLNANPFKDDRPPHYFFDFFFDGTGMPRVMPPAGGMNGAEGGRLEVQLRKPLVYIYLRGRAARYGFSIPIPSLSKVAGAEPVMACRLDRGEGYGQGVVYAAGAPIYGSVWNLRYALTNLPKNWYPPDPVNPLLK